VATIELDFFSGKQKTIIYSSKDYIKFHLQCKIQMFLYNYLITHIIKFIIFGEIIYHIFFD